MKQARWFPIAIGFILGATLPGLAQKSAAGPAEIIERPRQYIAQAYPATTQLLAGVADNRCFSGIRQGEPNARAVPGILCLDSTVVNGVPRLNLSSFVSCPKGQSWYVQTYRLTREVPASKKCPGAFTSEPCEQFGTRIRTWWTLQFTPPGTVFTLDLTVRCLDPKLRKTTFHVDRWTWEVVATIDTFENLLHLFHADAIGTMELPCIVGEDLFRDLLAGVGELRAARARGPEALPGAIFSMEGLIAGVCAMDDKMDPEVWFPKGPPGNGTSSHPSLGLIGIVETAETPCCCKLIVDLEYLGNRYKSL